MKRSEVNKVIQNAKDLLHKGLYAWLGYHRLRIETIRKNRPCHIYPKEWSPGPYKILIIQEEQITPIHFHWYKVEDIINRAGGNLTIEVYNSTDDEKLADTDVEITLDGVRKEFPAGTQIRLEPGESITLTTRLYHTFWAGKGNGPLIVGEVSKVNDDTSDNRFLEAVGRFPEIEEDCPPNHHLCTEYPLQFER